MGKRILLHVPENIKALDVRNWRDLFEVSTTILPGDEQVPDLTTDDKSGLKIKLDQELAARHIDRTEIGLAAIVAGLQESGYEVWFCRAPYLPDGVTDCFHGIISVVGAGDESVMIQKQAVSASGYLAISQEMLPENGFPLWRVIIDEGKIQTTSSGHWFQAKEKFLQELEERNGPVADTGILEDVQTIPYISRVMVAAKLQEIRDKLEALKKHKETIAEVSNSIRNLCVLFSPAAPILQEKRKELHQLYSDLKNNLENLSKRLAVLMLRTPESEALCNDILHFKNQTIANLRHASRSISQTTVSADMPVQRVLKSLEEIRNELAVLKSHKEKEIDPLAISIRGCSDKERSKTMRVKVIELRRSFRDRLKILKEAALDSMDKYKTPGDAVEWEKVKEDLRHQIALARDGINAMEKTRSKGVKAGPSAAYSLSQLAEPVVAPLRPVKRQPAPSSTITSAQEEVQQETSSAKRTRNI